MKYEDRAVFLMNRYPAIVDLQKKAHHRIPKVAREYLETGTDNDEALDRNILAFQKIRYKPQFLKGELNTNITCNLFGNDFSAPFGIAPIGLMSLMWPDIEIILAKSSKELGIPFSLSTVATETPEIVGQYVGRNGWFQLYAPKEKELAYNFLDRAKNAGFETLVITIDIPQPSRRQRTKRAGLQSPPKINREFIWEALKNPTWTYKTLRRGIPKLKMIESHTEFKKMMSVGGFMDNYVGGNLSWDYVQILRDYWKGPVLLKGILHEEDALRATNLGFDGIIVSNHGGRQLDAAISSIEALPKIAGVVSGKIKVLFDSGIRTGLDIIRALSLGADFVLIGRPFVYGVCALSEYGGPHVFQILKQEMENNMRQLGVQTLSEIKNLKPIIDPW